jgi:hypothetical protein
MLLSYGYGANIMLNSKRRIQQNVHLTKRILHLEQVNTTLRVELNKERESIKETLSQVRIFGMNFIKLSKLFKDRKAKQIRTRYKLHLLNKF